MIAPMGCVLKERAVDPILTARLRVCSEEVALKDHGTVRESASGFVTSLRLDTAQTRYSGASFPVSCEKPVVRPALLPEITGAGETKQMDEEVNAMRGILLGVLTGATVWFMVYVAMFH